MPAEIEQAILSPVSNYTLWLFTFPGPQNSAREILVKGGGGELRGRVAQRSKVNVTRSKVNVASSKVNSIQCDQVKGQLDQVNWTRSKVNSKVNVKMFFHRLPTKTPAGVLVRVRTVGDAELAPKPVAAPEQFEGVSRGASNASVVLDFRLQRAL